MDFSMPEHFTSTREVNLGPATFLDCLAFCIFLAPQLIRQVGWVDTILCALQALPFLLIHLPLSLIRERYPYLAPQRDGRNEEAKRRAFLQSPQRASVFADIVLQCVRYSFVHIPPRITRVFLSKEVALPYLEFRLLRNGYLGSPVPWGEVNENGLRGIWITHDPRTKPDIVIYYAHGGGFAAGSPYFYLEFLLTWVSVLRGAGYANPAIFALEYTLVPDATYPTQVDEALKGYEHVLAEVKDPSIVVVGGDSAGATLMLCLLLRLGLGADVEAEDWDRDNEEEGIVDPNAADKKPALRLPKPALAVLISPWPTLVSDRYRNTAIDYLDAEQLCRDVSWWKRASPSKGVFVTYGTEEVLAPETEMLVDMLKKAGALAGVEAVLGGIHVWPVAAMFLVRSKKDRIAGLVSVTRRIREHVPWYRIDRLG
ncbi:hypothetical protein VTJ49DRAFT_981 [Mycothermus thermophilus]|uniref:Alpha/beta hydrolase fold-3 domain-containing protein n=1 Tax=Humicola insolens TaxID=85995 RepID=A0ABR3VDQ3_HUMIN